MKLIEFLSPETQVRLSQLTDGTLNPPDINDPESLANVAATIVGDGPEADKWRLVVLLSAMHGLIGPRDAADICIAIGTNPNLSAATEALAAFSPAAKPFIESALVALGDQSCCVG